MVARIFRGEAMHYREAWSATARLNAGRTVGMSAHTRPLRPAAVVRPCLPLVFVVVLGLFELACDDAVCPTGTTEVAGNCVRNDRLTIDQGTSGGGADMPPTAGAPTAAASGSGTTSGTGANESGQVSGAGMAGMGSAGTTM